MGDSKPSVSVIVPAFNAERHISETLDSVAGQIYKQWECIVVNDGSTDDTSEIIRQRVEKDKRFIGITIPNSGVSKARNTGITVANGEYILPLDADDLLDKAHLETVMGIFRENASVRLVYTAVVKFGVETGKFDLGTFDYPTLLRHNMMQGTVYKKEDFLKVGGYRENMVDGLEDWDFWIALMEDFTKDEVVRIQEPLFFYRTAPGSRADMLSKGQRFNKMMDNLILNNFHIYQEYYPDIFKRVVEYDFNRKMLEKLPVRLTARILIYLSHFKNRYFANNKNISTFPGEFPGKR
jgi:glycosyltransferase involved in cell wall biosynthesis